MVKMLIVTVMGDNCTRFLDMCFKSVLNADKIIFCWGGEDYDTAIKYRDWASKYPEKFELISLKYDHDNKKQNGLSRNFYLSHMKLNYPDDYCLAIDADEVVEDLDRLKSFIQTCIPGVYSIRMRHFIGNFGKEDALTKEHMVLNRLFKISDADHYTEVEHSLLESCSGRYYQTNITTIFHLAYCSGMFDIRSRYFNHLRNSNMHTPEQLKIWYFQHLFGNYPVSVVKPMELPKIILSEFGIEPDEIYFMSRNRLEVKHFLMSKQWLDHFGCKTVLDLGCGLGLFGHAIQNYGVMYKGIELSDWAIRNTPFSLDIVQGNITDKLDLCGLTYDLVLLIDVLEHLEPSELDRALSFIKDYGRNFLFSIPYIGDPNLINDQSHKIYMTKEQWINKLSGYFRISEVPIYFLFNKQLLIGEQLNK